MTNASPTDHKDWGMSCDISFLSGFKAANITKDVRGFSNYVYRINATDGNFGIFYAVEPYPLCDMI